ncbi:hypothetical protein V8C26DRAFT_404836 [Trichoderma gracile]
MNGLLLGFVLYCVLLLFFAMCSTLSAVKGAPWLALAHLSDMHPDLIRRRPAIEKGLAATNRLSQTAQVQLFSPSLPPSLTLSLSLFVNKRTKRSGDTFCPPSATHAAPNLQGNATFFIFNYAFFLSVPYFSIYLSIILSATHTYTRIQSTHAKQSWLKGCSCVQGCFCSPIACGATRWRGFCGVRCVLVVVAVAVAGLAFAFAFLLFWMRGTGKVIRVILVTKLDGRAGGKPPSPRGSRVDRSYSPCCGYCHMKGVRVMVAGGGWWVVRVIVIEIVVTRRLSAVLGSKSHRVVEYP